MFALIEINRMKSLFARERNGNTQPPLSNLKRFVTAFVVAGALLTAIFLAPVSPIDLGGNSASACGGIKAYHNVQGCLAPYDYESQWYFRQLQWPTSCPQGSLPVHKQLCW